MLTLDEIALLREVARWRRNHKVTYFQWRPGKGFGVMTEWKLWVDDQGGRWGNRRQINVTYEPDRNHTDEPYPRIAVTKDYYGGDNFRELPASSVAETIDLLAALGYLPPHFSSAYRAGWDARESFVTREDNPDLQRDYWGNDERLPAVGLAW